MDGVGVATADIQEVAEHSRGERRRKVEMAGAFFSLGSLAKRNSIEMAAPIASSAADVYPAGMKLMFALTLGFCTLTAMAAETTPIEQEVATAIESPGVTIVHLWAPWCPNCKAELANGGWSSFLATHPDVNVIFVTVWRGTGPDGHELLAKHGVGDQSNFKLLVHPNASRSKGDKMTDFLGLPVTWIPTTWVYRGGSLRYALNYGELRFSMLEQMVRDASDKWDR